MTTGTRTTASAGSVQTTCVVLSENVIHLIANRPDGHSLTKMLFTVYGKGKSLRLPVELRTGETVKIRITSFDYQSSTYIGFTGEIANGSEFVSVRGTFTGLNHGSFQLINT